MRAPTDLLADALEGGLHDPQERVALAAALREDEDLASGLRADRHT